jgi:ankyrin repeat protein
LCLPCFDPGLSEERIKIFVSEGHYAFMDYAIASWVDHLSECVDHPKIDDPVSVEKLAGILDTFLSKHDTKYPQSTTSSKAIRESFHRFREHNFFDKLVQTVMYAKIQLQAPAKQANHRDPLDLLKRLADIRSALEKMVLKPTIIQKRKLEILYGSQLFKCPKIYCKFFYTGFPGLDERENHVMKHQRAYYCPYPGCHMSSLGCATPAELESHVSGFHQEIGQVSFPITSIQDPKSIQILKEVRGRNIGAIEIWIAQFNVENQVQISAIFKFYGTSPLSLAIELGDEELVHVFLRHIPKPAAGTQNWSWSQVVRVALNAKQDAIVKLLLQHYDGMPDNDWYLLIARALSIGLDKSTLYLLEASGGFRKRKEQRKSTVFTKAAECGRIFIIRHLISEYNLNPGCTDVKNRTSLAVASEFGQEEIVQFLISTGKYSSTSKSKEGATPASKAASNGHESIIRMLFPPGSDSPEMTPWLKCTELYNAVLAGNTKLVEQLLREHNIKPDLVDRNGYTLLLRSAESGHDDIVGLLLAHNVNVNRVVQDSHAYATEKAGKTALLLATIHEHENVVRRLLSQVNIDTEYKTSIKINGRGRTEYGNALQFAKKVGNVSIVEMLNDHKAKMEALGKPADQKAKNEVLVAPPDQLEMPSGPATINPQDLEPGPLN